MTADGVHTTAVSGPGFVPSSAAKWIVLHDANDGEVLVDKYSVTGLQTWRWIGSSWPWLTNWSQSILPGTHVFLDGGRSVIVKEHLSEVKDMLDGKTPNGNYTLSEHIGLVTRQAKQIEEQMKTIAELDKDLDKALVDLAESESARKALAASVDGKNATIVAKNREIDYLSDTVGRANNGWATSERQSYEYRETIADRDRTIKTLRASLVETTKKLNECIEQRDKAQAKVTRLNSEAYWTGRSWSGGTADVPWKITYTSL